MDYTTATRELYKNLYNKYSNLLEFTSFIVPFSYDCARQIYFMIEEKIEMNLENFSITKNTGIYQKAALETNWINTLEKRPFFGLYWFCELFDSEWSEHIIDFRKITLGSSLTQPKSCAIGFRAGLAPWIKPSFYLLNRYIWQEIFNQSNKWIFTKLTSQGITVDTSITYESNNYKNQNIGTYELLYQERSIPIIVDENNDIISVINNFNNRNYPLDIERIYLNNNNIIDAGFGEPYFITDSISPVNSTFTQNFPKLPGGLSYRTTFTDLDNYNMIKEYLKFTINYDLPSDTFVLFGVGSTQLFAAYYFAVQKYLDEKITISSFVPKIYYTLHRNITFTLPNVEWKDNLKNPDILVYVSPNNPNGLIANINKNKFGKYNVFDVVYDVPLFTGKYESVNKELYEKFNNDKSYTIISSFSKLGLSGARCGFLLTRDENLIEGIKFYIENNSLVPPSLGITLTREVFNTYYLNKDWYNTNYNKLKNRIIQFIELSKNKDISILNITFDVPFIYNNKSAQWWLDNYNVIVRSGIDFADTPQNSRFNLMISDNEWNNFVKRFSCL
jgi:hypothetical protein